MKIDEKDIVSAEIDSAREASMPAEGGASEQAQAKLGFDAADEKVLRLGTGSIPKLIAEFAVPAIAGYLVNAAYNIIDSIFLGHAIGAIGIAATTVANPIMTVFLAIAMLVGTGGNALCALKLGEGRKDVAERTLGNTFMLCVLVWVVVCIVASCPPAMDALLSLSSATDEVRPYAYSFMQIIFYGYFVQCVGFGINQFIRTTGAPNRALLTMVIGAVGCIFFNYIFVIVMGLGVAGSALATVCGQGLSCISVLWYFLFTKGVPLKLRVKNFKPEWSLCGRIIALGLASFALQAGMAVTNFLTNMLLVHYGELSPLGADSALASIGLAVRVIMFLFTPLFGVSVAVQPLLGFNYGAKKYDRVRITWKDGILTAVGVGTVLWALAQFFALQIVAIFGLNDPELSEFTAYVLRVMIAVMPIVGYQIVGSNYFTATGQPVKSIILGLSRQILFLIPLMFILPELLPTIIPGIQGLDAVYIATPVADVFAILVTTVFVVVEWKRLKRREAEQAAAGEAAM
ncbi:MAG: MATE family efflux transporter [Eggerthellaceae bacterium]|nr:MATE family efflux transporter [Eggerthellaceae bacterium]